MKKKLLSLLLALVLVLGMLPAVSAAEVVASGHGWDVDWVLTDDGTLTISGNGPMRDRNLDFESPWMRYYEEIRKVVINEGVTSIEDFAFTMFENLTSVTIPVGVTRIGMSALGGCIRLESLHLPASLKTLEDMAVSGSGMEAFTVEEGNLWFTTIDGVLTDLEKTELIAFPAGRGGSYTVPDSIRKIHDDAFMDCNELTGIIFPDHLTELPDAAFYGLESLTAVHLPASLTELPRAAFYECAKLASIELPTGLTAIGFDAFCGCTSLKTVVVPASVESLNTQVFADCSSLTNVVFLGSAPAMDPDSGIFYGDILTAWYPAGDESWTGEIMQDYYGNVTWKSFVPLPFGDVLPFQFWYKPVAWAVENNVTTGISATEFGPTTACNRAQVVTFLWRAAGEPEPVSAENPFVDVQAGSFYEKAVLWAVEQGITNGTDATHFSPNQSCNRATVVTFLHRAAKSPAAESSENPFTDVPADTWYTEPVLWAVENGITNGLSATEFGPDASCNRAQIVTFLYRTYNQ